MKTWIFVVNKYAQDNLTQVDYFDRSS